MNNCEAHIEYKQPVEIQRTIIESLIGQIVNPQKTYLVEAVEPVPGPKTSINVQDIIDNNNRSFAAARQKIATEKPWLSIGERYRMIDDAVFAVYRLRKEPKQKTIDFIINKIIPQQDSYRFELLMNELERIRKKVL